MRRAPVADWSSGVKMEPRLSTIQSAITLPGLDQGRTMTPHRVEMTLSQTKGPAPWGRPRLSITRLLPSRHRLPDAVRRERHPAHAHARRIKDRVGDRCSDRADR